MDWIDYREKLGIGFNDTEKCQYFYTQITNSIGASISLGVGGITVNEYRRFCDMTGSCIDCRFLDNYQECDRLSDCLRIIKNHKNVFSDYLSYFVGFINSLDEIKGRLLNRSYFESLLANCLKNAHIQYDLIEENGKIFVFPKGAEELDNALVSEPLTWLNDYPNTHKTYVIALKQYSDGVYIRDVADNLRKALESFLQEFLQNSKNLETNKNEICRYLARQGVDAGISGLFQPLINAYKNINDRVAKHNDAVDAKLLEFLLYQTGILIRMVLTVKQSQSEEVVEHAD